MRRMRWGAAAAALVLVVAGCSDDSDDDDDVAADTTESTETTDEADDTGGDEGVDDELTEVCALAEEMNSQENFPSAEQLEQYQAAAPDEIIEAVNTAAEALIPAADDQVASFIAFADDDVTAAIEEVDAFETERCGIDHGDDGAPQGDAAAEDGNTVVDVVASEYTFEVGDVAAGPTAFRLTNEGQEAHFFFVTKIVEGHTLQEFLDYQGDPTESGLVEEPFAETSLAAPGGEDEEFLNVDLVPGDYALICFLPGPDGTPHAFSGMAVTLSVS